MPVKMTHPLHGAHWATGSEVEPMKKNGWTEAPPKVKEVAAVEEAAEEVEAAAKPLAPPPAARKPAAPPKAKK